MYSIPQNRGVGFTVFAPQLNRFPKTKIAAYNLKKDEKTFA